MKASPGFNRFDASIRRLVNGGFGVSVLLQLLFANTVVADTTASSRSQPLHPFVIQSGEVIHDFQVEIAATAGQRARGLMFRKSLPPQHGMLFVYQPPRPVSMWMKNTYIPLDILFFSADGKVIKISRNATPHSLRHIRSGGITRAVLELNAGQADELGLSIGDQAYHGAFQTKK